MANRRFSAKQSRVAPAAGKSRFGLGLFLVVAGGFAGTFGALQMEGDVPEAAASVALPLRGEMPSPRGEVAPPASLDRLSARFGLCHRGGGRNCVVDGDTFWFEGEKYRIADIDTPETHPARCAEEAALGEAATRRLHGWLNEGAFTLETIDRDTDQYDRKLRIVRRRGASVGDALVDAGLARRWEGYRRPWC